MNQVKEQLSKLLASENINVEHINTETAMFNLQTRTLSLPNWAEDVSNDLYDLMISHEVGHALYTPVERTIELFNDKNFPNFHFFLNVVEDARIERMIKDKFPGLKKNYHFGYKELLDKDFFSLKSKDLNELSLIDRLNLNEKIGSFTLINFSNKEKSFVNKIKNTKTFEDVVHLAKQLYFYSKAEQFIQENDDYFISGDGYDDGEGDGDGEENGEDGFNSKNSGLNNNFQKEFKKINGNSNGAGGRELLEKILEKVEKDELINEELNKFLEENNLEKKDFNEFVPESSTQKNLEKNIKELNSNKKVNSITVQFPKINYKDHIVPVETVSKNIKQAKTKNALLKIRKSSKKSVDYLIKMFEMKKAASFYVRNKISKTGTIETSKLYSYKYNDDIFKKVSTVPEGKNHGMVMLLDYSGSMTGEKIKECFKQIVTTVTFCKKMNIPFSVFLFGCLFYKKDEFDQKNYYYNPKTYTKINYKINDLYSDPMDYNLIEILNSEMGNKNFEETLTKLSEMIMNGGQANFVMNGTPLIESLHILDGYIGDFRKKHKVEVCNLMVVTDGVANQITSYKTENHRNYLNYSKIYVRDEVTKKSYIMQVENNNILKAKLQMIKDKHNCNLISFFIGSMYDNKYIVNNYAKLSERIEKYKELRKNGCSTIEDTGFDEYHLIVEEEISENNELIVQTDKSKPVTTKKLASAFMKFLKKKSLNKIILSKFVERISKQVA